MPRSIALARLLATRQVLTLAQRSANQLTCVNSDFNPAKYTLSAFAIGDWGITVNQDSCCTRSATYNDFDVNAEDIVANLMDQ
ncbi:unnamed protein product [Phytophthora fragariaefolia]|uniref:Unnamed protein product n=1 Tax=Phytophthora fragariaefolia TaxID=1490495 RepID=A0A9W7D6I0_9STRA|nr:unnamed protein product [Phytophthora fragariaefolia]